MAKISYIIATMKHEALIGFDRKTAKQWAKTAEWLKLEIIEAPTVSSGANEGFVEFIAYYKLNGAIQKLHEKSRFLRENDRWYYVSGRHI